MKRSAPVRIAIVLGLDGTLEAAGVVRGDVAEGARFLGALRDPLEHFVTEAKRRAARLSPEPAADKSSASMPSRPD